MRRLLFSCLLLGLAFLLAWGGLGAGGRALRAQEEARRLVARALGAGRSSTESEREVLFRRAQELDPGPGVGACAEGARLEKWGHWEEAAAAFRRCLAGDPRQAYAHLAYAEALLRAWGRGAYVEARAELHRFLEDLAGAAPNPPDPASRRAAEERIQELEDLLADPAVDRKTAYTTEEIVELLTHPRSRGSSRYDGPRVPLRLAFRPGDVTLGAAAEAQLQAVGRALRDGLLAADRIQIEGHTDSAEGGSRPARLALAGHRAQAVRHFLVTRCGIPARRLSVAALADDYPLEPNDRAEGRAANRRVELVDLEEKRELLRDVRDR